MQPYQPMGPGMGPGQPGPYASPYQYPPVQPSGPRTLGTLSIIFGAIVAVLTLPGAFGFGTGLVGMMTKGLPDNPGLSAMQDYLEAIRIPTLIQSLVMEAMSIWLLVLGVGQRRYRAWAARQSVTWGVVGLVVLVGMLVMALTVTGPAMERFMETIANRTHTPNPVGSFAKVGAVFGLIFYLPYPIILIAAFRKPSTVAAMNT